MPHFETSYGEEKRLDYLVAFCREHGVGSVLDVGCGTGTHLTYPLAQAMPEMEIIGVDNDAPSIAYATEHCRAPNLSFMDDTEVDPDRRFDMVIASEVLEHVEDPDGFLLFLKSKTTPGGYVFLTTPNGYGLFEVASFLHALITALGVVTAIKAVLRRGGGQGGAVQGHTLASSPHLNFFGWSQLNAMFEAAGLRTASFRSKTFLCGPGLSGIVRRAGLLSWNQSVADKLPPRATSGWMFFLADGPVTAAPRYSRGPLARFRRFLNEKRDPPA